MTSEEDRTVTRLVQKALRRHKRGHAIDLSAIDKGNADIASEVRTRLAAKGVDLSISQVARQTDDIHLEQTQGNAAGREFEQIAVSASLAQLERYQLIRRLGSGAMGEVYRAHDLNLSRDVAIKVPRIEGVNEQVVRERFRREAQAVAQLDHPGICRLHDFGEVDGLPYLTMSYVKGKPLSFFMTAKQFQVRQAVVLVGRIAKSLHHAHLQGVLHRDLKPANILINQEGKPIVTDFGLACFYDNSVRSRMTTDGDFMGSPAYMSPEQARGDLRQIGPPTDIYSLGVILYELLTGELPFSGKPMAIIGQLIADDIQAPLVSTIRPEANPSIDRICAKMLAKRIEDRYSTLEEVEKDLGSFVKGAPTSSDESTGLTDEMVTVDDSSISTRDAKIKGSHADSDRTLKGYKTMGLGALAVVLIAGLAHTFSGDLLEFGNIGNAPPVLPEKTGESAPAVVELFAQQIFDPIKRAEFEPLSLKFASPDAESQKGVSFELTGDVPDGCRINSETGVLEWTPSRGQGGQAYVWQVQARLPGQPPQSVTLAANITPAKPLLNATETELSINEFDPVAISLATGYDPGTPIRYTLVGDPPAGCEFNESTGVLRWTPKADQGGQQYNIVVAASTQSRGDDLEQITVTVNVKKAQPLLKTFPDPIEAEELFDLRIPTATEDTLDPQEVQFTLLGHYPEGCEIDSKTGVIRWTPRDGDGDQEYSFEVRATTDGRPKEIQELRIHVAPSFKPEDALPDVHSPLPPTVATAVDREEFRDRIKEIVDHLQGSGINQRTKERELALEYDKLVRRFGESDRVEYAYGLFLQRWEKLDEALEHFSKLTASSPWSLDAQESIVWSHLEPTDDVQFRDEMTRLLEQIRRADEAGKITEEERLFRTYWCGQLVALFPELMPPDSGQRDDFEQIALSVVPPKDIRCFKSGVFRMRHDLAASKDKHRDEQQAERTALEERLEVANVGLQEVETQITTLNTQRQELETEFNQIKAKLEQALEKPRSDLKKAEIETGPVFQAYAATQSALGVAQKEVATLTGELANISDDVELYAKTSQRLSNANERVVGLTNDLARQAPSFKAANDRLSKFQAQILDLKQQQQAALVNYSRHKSKLDSDSDQKKIDSLLRRKRNEAERVQRDLDKLEPFRVRLEDYDELFEFTKRGSRIINSIPN